MKQTVTFLNLSKKLLLLAFCCATLGLSSIQAQSLDCPADITLPADIASDDCLTLAEVVATSMGMTCMDENPTNDSPFALDNASLDASGNYPVGTTTVNFSICDGAFTCSVDVTIEPAVPVVMAIDTFAFLDENGNVNVDSSYFDDGSFDPCGEAITFTIDQSSFDCSNIGDVIINITVENESGIMAMETATLTISDTLAPSILEYDDIVVSLLAGQCDSVITFDDPLTVDNCSAPITLSQNTDNTTVVNAISCGSGEMVHHYRIYDMTGNTIPVQINNVTVGVFSSFNSPSVTVLIRELNGPFLRSNLTTIAQTTMTLGNISMGSVDFPISAVLTDKIYVLEIEAPNFTSNGFIVGVNFAGETDPSYISAISCGEPEPATYASVGFTNYNAVMFMEGLEADVTGVLIDGIPSGSAFPIGTTVNTYEFSDDSGNTSESTIDIIVNEFEPDGLACLTNINLSIDAFTCESMVTPDMVLTTETLGCLENCTVEIMNLDLTDRSDLFTVADVGQSFMYRVCCGDLCCMGTVNVEDKTPPQIVCSNDTISCGELLVFPPPVTTENCSVAELVLLDETFEDVECTDDSLMMIVTRTYQAIDIAGNESNICEQILSIRKFDIGDVMPPPNQNVDIECGANFPMDANGAPDPNFYGAPSLNGVNLYTNQFLECNLFVSFQDQTFPTGFNSFSIVRTFDVTNWYCGTDSTRQFVQIFDFADNQDPVITCPDNMTFTTSGHECSAEVLLAPVIVTDLCDDDVSVTVQYEGGFIDGNGGIAYLPNGTSQVTYTATDDSGNSSTCSFQVMVDDAQAPFAICDQFTVVSLTEDGIAIVDAEEFDDGSFDPCGPVTFDVRRMVPNCDPTDILFDESITFCCADLGVQQQIVLRVTDAAGNTNECMVFAEVQDKIAPVILQGLPDITLSCEFPFNEDDTEQFGTIQMDVEDIDSILLTAELVQFNGQPLDGFVLGNCLELLTDEFTFSNINSCGIGSATRVITFTNAQGLTASDVQFITFVNPSPFVFDDIDFPDDYELFNVCSIEGTNPENLPDGFNFPTFVEDGCDQVGIDYEDQLIDNSNGSQSCFKILRTWYVLDWCQNNGGTYQTFESTQVIEVFNFIDPEITGDCTNRTQCSFDINCGPAFVELVNTGTDDCTTENFLQWSYEIDAFSNGSIDIVGSTNDASGEYPVGIHTITWTLDDGCGNTDMCSYTFEIENCKTPTPYCFDNLTAGLTPMDLDGDGEVETEMLMLPPSFFDAGSFHVCGFPVHLSFSADVNDTLKIFGCDDIGEQPIQLWVTGENGNQDFCATSLIVQDNNDVDLCPEMLNVTIMGELKTSTEETIGEANVILDGAEITQQTEDDGQYAFVDMPIGGAYTIVPSKTTDPLNGVTGLDIVLIQKHILGLDPLDNPYKMIAGDVNNSAAIDGQDIIQLRRLLLGHYEDFPANTSWRFIDSDHVFIDENNPWIADLPETYTIPSLDENEVVDFVGVKTGDVNNSSLPNGLIGDVVDTRSDETLELYIDNAQLNAGENIWVAIKAAKDMEIVGAQLGVAFAQNGLQIMDVASGKWELDESYYKLVGEQNLKLLWTNSTAVSLSKGDVLFEIQVRTTNDTELSNTIALDDEIMMNENYSANLETGKVVLSVRDRNLPNETLAELTMKQNEPNPWKDETKIIIESPVNSNGSLRIMDITGKVIYKSNITVQEGVNEFLIKRNELPTSGVLYYEFEMNETRIMKKMILIK